VGKTRLGLQVATELSNAFTDGVSFVSLAPLSDPDLVLPALTQALRLPEARGRSPLEHLQASLHDKHLLLLLDNFEQVASAAVQLVALLQTCPHLKAMVTSRALLHVRGEYEVQVSPLDLPDPNQFADVELLRRNAAVTLFTQRAQAHAPDFALTGPNAPVIAAICTRLDGLPLAIELAAARIKLLSPQRLLSRLEHRLDILTSGAQDLPVRQQTLRATLQWSYELLSPGEQRLFRLLSVFVGGCMLEAVEAVCHALLSGATAVLDGVQRLLDNNLLFERKPSHGEARLMMLETIREYGQACLASSGEAEATRHAHAEYYLALAEEAEPRLISAEQLRWSERLEQEHDNLRAALSWLLEKEQIELALRLGGALGYFWLWHAHCREGLQWLEQALARSSEVLAPVRAKALYNTGAMAYYGGGDHSRAVELIGEGLKLYRELGDKQGIAISLNALGHTALTRGDYTALHALYEESLSLLEVVGDTWHRAEALYLSAYGCYAQGNYARARALGGESLALCRGLGDLWGSAVILHALGLFAFTQGDYATARTFYEESLNVSQTVGEKWVAALCLVGLGEVVAVEGNPARAACLWGAAEALRAELGAFIPHAEHVSYERSMSTVRAQLSEDVFSSAWAEGRTMSLEQVLAAQGTAEILALIPTEPLSAPPTRMPPTSPAGLTTREMEVLRLLAQGLTSAQIAERLVIGLVTVNSHVRSIYSKLEVTSRAAATRYALEHHLL
jgi:predicted ATPase/DNA-binding CsgD family transcriptional regulator